MVMSHLNSPTANVEVYEQLPAGGCAEPSVNSTNELPASPNLGDMDNDGRLDLVLMNNGYGSFTVHYQLPDGGLGEEIHRPAGDIQQLYPQQDLASIGDLTGDGKLDIAYLGVNDGLVVVAQGPDHSVLMMDPSAHETGLPGWNHRTLSAQDGECRYKRRCSG
jgi:hypothetical protein